MLYENNPKTCTSIGLIKLKKNSGLPQTFPQLTRRYNSFWGSSSTCYQISPSSSLQSCSVPGCTTQYKLDCGDEPPS